MKFALAGHLGRTVAELEQTLDAEEFGYWMALMGVEPWGDYRQDCLSALVQSATLAPWAGNRIKLADLMPKWGKAEPKKNWKESVSDFFRSARGLKGAK